MKMESAQIFYTGGKQQSCNRTHN